MPYSHTLPLLATTATSLRLYAHSTPPVLASTSSHVPHQPAVHWGTPLQNLSIGSEEIFLIFKKAHAATKKAFLATKNTSVTSVKQIVLFKKISSVTEEDFLTIKKALTIAEEEIV